MFESTFNIDTEVPFWTKVSKSNHCVLHKNQLLGYTILSGKLISFPKLLSNSSAGPKFEYNEKNCCILWLKCQTHFSRVKQFRLQGRSKKDLLEKKGFDSTA